MKFSEILNTISKMFPEVKFVRFQCHFKLRGGKRNLI